MDTTHNISKGKIYTTPQIERIELDNEISLILQSNINPVGEPIGAFEYFNNDPFKTKIG